MKKKFIIIICLFLASSVVFAKTDIKWVTQIDMQPAKPKPGDTVTFRATFKVTTDSASGLEVVAGVDGANQFQMTYPFLPRAHMEPVMFTWVATPGTHQVRFHADPANKIDKRPHNNMKELTFDVGGSGNPQQGVYVAEPVPVVDPTLFAFKPNFVPGNFRFDPEPAIVGKKFNIYFWVANAGEGKSLSVPGVKVRLNNLPPVILHKKTTMTGPEMKPGDKLLLNAEYHMKHIRPPCKLEVVVDGANRIAEMNEGDNRFTMNIPCEVRNTENLKVIDFQVNQCSGGTNVFQFTSMYKDDQCVLVTATVKNEGTKATPPGVLWDLNVWGQVTSGMLPPLGPGQTKNIYVTGKTGCGCWFVFTIDSTDMLKESDENDNGGGGTLYDCK